MYTFVLLSQLPNLTLKFQCKIIIMQIISLPSLLAYLLVVAKLTFQTNYGFF